MQTRRNVTAYVGLPSGRKIGVSVGNEPNSCGVQIVTVTNVTEKSVMSGILFPGDIITQLNGRNVPSDEMAFTDDLSVEDFQDLAVDEFVQMLNVAGEVRYLLITHDQTMESIPHMAAQMVSVSGKSIDVRVSNSEKLGISVALEGRKNVSGLDMTINKLMPSKRSNAPLLISHVSESSQLNGQVCVGDQITHVNGHLLIGIYPGEFVEILKDIGIDKNNGLVLTIRRA
jgi:C-terminal processing protease CtpA/Prc